MNKELAFSIVPQKIAIISSDTAAGYQDFINQIENNNFGYKFYIKLFPSIMQGLQAEESIINTLEKIYKHEDFFDLVVIIRGGGSQADLSCFNSYLLATNVAQFPIPVVTGIGHDKDESIVDIVAYRKLKTPTAVAEYIIEKISDFEENLHYLKDNILNLVTGNIQDQKTKLAQYGAITVPAVKNNLDKYNYQLGIIVEKLKNSTKQFSQIKINQLLKLSNLLEKTSTKVIFNKSEKIRIVENQLKHRCELYTQKQNLIIDNLENKALLLNPENILKRGYSITYFNGKKIKDSKKIKKNDEIITKLFSGLIRSRVREKFEK
jgi:exodeoxyribonuclease VII large subunit